MTAKRVAIYARVSTDGQKVDLQLDELRAFAARRGWTVVAEYIDHGITGTKEKRPQLDEMMARVRRGGVDVVLVWKFSRFARSVRHLVTCLPFQVLGVDFVSMSESIDTTTAAGKLLFHIIAAVDEFFIDVLRENTCAGLKAAQRRGRRLGRPRAERRHADQKGERLDVDAARALIAAGASCRTAARQLGVSEATLRRALARAPAMSTTP
jgi:DNA invertase Pin-like site-specific DNA recombinase